MAPILARVKHWEEKQKEFEEQHLKILDKSSSDVKQIKANRLKAHQLKEESYAAKVRAAFYMALLRNPFNLANLEDTCSLYMPSFEDRQLALVYDKTDPFLILNQTQKTISIDEIARLSISQISSMI